MKKILIAVVIIILVIVGFLAMRMKKQPVVETTEPEATPTMAFPTVTDSIHVDLKPKAGVQSVVLSVTGLTPDIQSIEYELTYTTAAGLPRGVLGKIQLKGEKEVSRDDIVLGTCSSGHCVYDTGVTSVNLTLKLNSESGASVYQHTYSM